LADATYVTTTRLPADVLWAFVQDMDHWARFVTGYQSHEKKSDTESFWTLKGDLGVLSRTLTFRVLITEWNGPSRVRFALEGQNEPMRGEGAFTIEVLAAEGAEAAPDAPPGAPAHTRGFWLRLFEAFWRRVLRALGGRVSRAAAPVGAGAAAVRMSFALRLEPGGPMAPMVNAMLKPLMLPAAEDLANRILAHLEGVQGGSR
jgi:hypothetical protein